ncbi:MAG: hypothetical protein WB783_02355 [Arenicellales bacterium]|jgi:hypothetical protein
MLKCLIVKPLRPAEFMASLIAARLAIIVVRIALRLGRRQVRADKASALRRRRAKARHVAARPVLRWSAVETQSRLLRFRCAVFLTGKQNTEPRQEGRT